MAEGPPIPLLQSAWFPFIFAFASRANMILQNVPGLRITSWYRNPETNRDVGGDAESQHLFALGLDVEGSDDALREVIAIAPAVGLVPDREPGHAHVQLFPRGALARAGVHFPS